MLDDLIGEVVVVTNLPANGSDPPGVGIAFRLMGILVRCDNGRLKVEPDSCNGISFSEPNVIDIERYATQSKIRVA